MHAHRIDVHHHILPPNYVRIVGDDRIGPLIVAGKTPVWTPQHSIEAMDRNGIEKSITSISAPGLWFGDVETTRRLTRECNDYAAKMRHNHPGRFGLFAAIPWPDVEGSLKEAEYALDTLKADGICMFTSYGDRWLGHSDFNPLFEELNRRKAIVYVHPHAAACCMNLIAEVNESIIEYGTDTTRAINSMIFTGASTRYPNIQWIWSHAGGTMPFLIERMVNLAKIPQVAAKLPNRLMPELKRFYYDTAQASNGVALGALKAVAGASQIVFGTDYPYRLSIEHVEGLAGAGLSTEEMIGIDHRNALRLLPNLAKLIKA